MRPIFQNEVEVCRHPRDSLRAVPDVGEEPRWPIVVCVDCGAFDRARVEVLAAAGADPGLVAVDDAPTAEADAAAPLAGAQGGLHSGHRQEAPVVVGLPGDHPGAPKVVHEPRNPAKPVEVLAPEAEAKAPDVVVRALVDLPPFVDARDRTLTLKAGDIASVSPGIAGLLQRRGKAAILEEGVFA